MSFIVDTFVLFLSMFFFFSGGWLFFIKQLFRDYEVRHRIVLLLFSGTFALSCTMFELIIFEIVGYLDQMSRFFHWKFCIYVTLFGVIVLLPFYIAYFVISAIPFLPRARLTKGILATICWLSFLYFFWKIGDPFPILSPKHGIFSIEQCIGWFVSYIYLGMFVGWYYSYLYLGTYPTYK